MLREAPQTRVGKCPSSGASPRWVKLRFQAAFRANPDAQLPAARPRYTFAALSRAAHADKRKFALKILIRIVQNKKFWLVLQGFIHSTGALCWWMRHRAGCAFLPSPHKNFRVWNVTSASNRDRRALERTLHFLAAKNILLVIGIRLSSEVCSLHLSTPTSCLSGNGLSGLFNPITFFDWNAFLSTFGWVWCGAKAILFTSCDAFTYLLFTFKCPGGGVESSELGETIQVKNFYQAPSWSQVSFHNNGYENNRLAANSIVNERQHSVEWLSFFEALLSESNRESYFLKVKPHSSALQNRLRADRHFFCGWSLA